MITGKTVGDAMLLSFKGKMTIGTGDVQLREAVREALDRGFRNIILDVRELTSIDSSGIGELVSAFTSVTKEGGHFMLVSGEQKFPQKDYGLIDILENLQFREVFDIYPNAAQAVAAFQEKSGGGGGDRAVS